MKIVDLILDKFYNGFAKKRVAPLYYDTAYLQYPDMKADDLINAYLTNEWICTAVERKANVMTLTKLRMYKKMYNGNKKEITDNPILSLIKKPNDFMTRIEFLERISMYLDLVGEAFFYVDNITNEIWSLRPDRVKVIPSRKDFVGGYEYTGETGQVQKFNVENILHFKKTNPISDYRGASTLKASAETIDGDNYAKKWNRNFFLNGARPDSILMTDQRLNEESINKLESQWRAKFKGVEKAHKMAILQRGLKFWEGAKTQKDMEFSKLGEDAMTRILAVIGYPKGMIEPKNVNRSSLESLEYTFQLHVNYPRLKRIEEILTNKLIPLYRLDGSYYLEFDNPVPENTELELKKIESRFRTGALSPDEIRQMDGLEKLPDGKGENFYIGSNLKPIDQQNEKQQINNINQDNTKN